MEAERAEREATASSGTVGVETDTASGEKVEVPREGLVCG